MLLSSIDDGLVRILTPILADSAIDIGKASSASAYLAHILPLGHIHTTWGRILTLVVIEPLLDINDVNDFRTDRIFQNGILHILIHSQIDEHLTILLLPLGNHIEPELHEMQRTGKLLTNRMDDIGLPLKGIQRLADILTVELSQDRILDVIELDGSKDTLVACEIHWFQEWSAIHIIGRTPGAIHPMGSGLQDIMLEVMLILEQ